VDRQTNERLGGPNEASMAALINLPQPRAAAPAPGGLADYLARHVGAARPYAAVTAGAADGLLPALAIALPTRDGERHVWLTAPLHSGRALLLAILGELGLAPATAGLDELHDLLLVYLRHQAARGRRVVVLLAAADRCGPCAFDLLQTLVRIPGPGPGTAALTAVLCGGPALHRVLDSPGMASARTALRERYDLDRQRPWLARAPLFIAPPPTAPAAATARVDVLLDGQVQARLTVASDRLLIGRDPAAAIRIASRYVSREHAVILRRDGADQLLDLRSRNGTLVNGRRITEHRLGDGDVIAIGNYRLRYRRTT
jgi:hypothetical protein